MIRCGTKVAGALLAATLLWTPASGQGSDPPAAASASSRPLPRQKPQSDSGYYVEFRAAQIGLYGHSYAVYGRLDRRDNPLTTSYADLHPMGGYGVMALGHFVPVPANTEWDPEVLALPVTAKYRVKLNQTQYNNLTAAVERANANKRPYWNAVTNNCNHFIGELARAVGLRVPMQFHLSYGFVPDLQEINETNAPAADASPPPKVKRASAPKVKPASTGSTPATTDASAR
jgi:hypothetical protein